MLVVVIASFVAGMVVHRMAGEGDRWVGVIDRWVLTVALPALVVSKMSRASLGADVVTPVVISWMAMIVCAVTIIAVGRLATWTRETVGALLMVAVLGNTSFLGLGVVEGLLGHDHLPSAIAYDQLGTFLALATYGSFIAGRFGAGAGGWRPIVRRLVRFGPFLALLASPAVAFADPPAWVYRVLDVPAVTVAPVAMFALGWRFRFGDVTGRMPVVAVGLFVKMVMVPLLVVVASLLLASPSDVAWSASILQAAAPPMVTAGAVAVSAGLDSAVASVTVAVGTILAFVTLPLWWMAVR